MFCIIYIIYIIYTYFGFSWLKANA